MKNVLLSLVAAATMSSTAAFAKDTTVDSLLCYVKANGSYTGQIVLGSQFFSKANSYSNRNNTCVVAKIDRESFTSRIYVNGRRIGERNSGMSNSEVDRELADYGFSLRSCTVFSCEESAL